MVPSPFGDYIKQRRLEAGLSLREVAREIGISHVYLGEVERGARRLMPQEHWKRIVAALPNVNLKELSTLADISAPLDAQKLEGGERDVVVALARRIATASLGKDEVQSLLSILQKQGAT